MRQREIALDEIADATSASLPDGIPDLRASLPVRKRPSKNSVLLTRDNRPIVLFVTVNAAGRQLVFARAEAVHCIVSAWQNASDWHVGRYVIMPDHLHFFCSPACWPVPDFHTWMARWKARVARTFPIEHNKPLWQRGCWDVQMRTMNGYREKWTYVRQNPVRRGLAEDVEAWPYQGFIHVLEWHDA